MTTIPSALAPEYVCEINQPIALYEGEAVLFAGGDQEVADCVVAYTWRPLEGPEIHFPSLTSMPRGNCRVEISSIGLKADINVRMTRFGPSAISLVGHLRGLVRMGSASNLVSLSFHLGNFPFVVGEAVQRGASVINGRIHLEHGPWVIDIDPVPDKAATPLIDGLRESRGCAITHFGRLVRGDGATFSGDEADAVLRDLSRTLSFTRAAFSTPLLLTGYDSGSVPVWRCWSAYKTSSWSVHGNWFSTMYPAILRSVFAGWRNVSAGSDAEIINAAGHLYIDAHEVNLALESRLVIAQAALEGLADGWPFKPLAGAPTLTAFSGGAAQRIASIAVAVGLPIDVPASLGALAALDHPKASSPGLEKMTWVRNSVTHLGNFLRLTGQPWQVKFEAFELAASHLELALLRLLSAEGPHRDRLSAKADGQVKNKFAWQP